jgi:hypothetical protein
MCDPYGPRTNFAAAHVHVDFFIQISNLCPFLILFLLLSSM